MKPYNSTDKGKTTGHVEYRHRKASPVRARSLRRDHKAARQEAKKICGDT